MNSRTINRSVHKGVLSTSFKTVFKKSYDEVIRSIITKGLPVPDKFDPMNNQVIVRVPSVLKSHSDKWYDYFAEYLIRNIQTKICRRRSASTTKYKILPNYIILDCSNEMYYFLSKLSDYNMIEVDI